MNPAVGLGVLAVIGAWMAYQRHGLKQRGVRIKLRLIALIMVYGYVSIVPAVIVATEIAVRSVALGELVPAYRAAYLQESIFGAVNVGLTIIAAAVGCGNSVAKPTTANRHLESFCNQEGVGGRFGRSLLNVRRHLCKNH